MHTILPDQMSSQIRFLFEIVHKQKHQNQNPKPKILISRQEEVSTGFSWKHGNKNRVYHIFDGNINRHNWQKSPNWKLLKSNFSFKIIFLKNISFVLSFGILLTWTYWPVQENNILSYIKHNIILKLKKYFFCPFFCLFPD